MPSSEPALALYPEVRFEIYGTEPSTLKLGARYVAKVLMTCDLVNRLPLGQYWRMDGFEFLLLLLAWAIGGASPGPATLAIAGTSMERGRAAGLSVAAGIVTGSASWGLAAAFGMSALMLANAWLVEILRYVGAAYLLFLAFKAGKSALSDKPLAQVSAGRGGMRRLFVKGLLLHLTNPKAIFGWGAMFAVIIPAGSDPNILTHVFLPLITVSSIVFFGYALLFSTAGFIQGYQRMRRGFEGAFALLFGIAGVKILTTRFAP